MSLISTVKQLMDSDVPTSGVSTPSASSAQDDSERRAKAVKLVVDQITGCFEDKVKRYASLKRHEARLMEYSRAMGVKTEGFYVNDLIRKEDVIKQVQDWVDSQHPDTDGSRAFLVYCNRVGKPNTDKDLTKYAVFVNWKKDSWDAITNRPRTKPTKPVIKQTPA